MNQFLQTNELMQMFGYKTIQSLELFLIKNKIKYIRGRGTITTSSDAINEVMFKDPINKSFISDDFEP